MRHDGVPMSGRRFIKPLKEASIVAGDSSLFMQMVREYQRTREAEVYLGAILSNRVKDRYGVPGPGRFSYSANTFSGGLGWICLSTQFSLRAAEEYAAVPMTDRLLAQIGEADPWLRALSGFYGVDAQDSNGPGALADSVFLSPAVEEAIEAMDLDWVAKPDALTLPKVRGASDNDLDADPWLKAMGLIPEVQDTRIFDLNPFRKAVNALNLPGYNEAFDSKTFLAALRAWVTKVALVFVEPAETVEEYAERLPWVIHWAGEYLRSLVSSAAEAWSSVVQEVSRTLPGALPGIPEILSTLDLDNAEPEPGALSLGLAAAPRRSLPQVVAADVGSLILSSDAGSEVKYGRMVAAIARVTAEIEEHAPATRSLGMVLDTVRRQMRVMRTLDHAIIEAIAQLWAKRAPAYGIAGDFTLPSDEPAPSVAPAPAPVPENPEIPEWVKLGQRVRETNKPEHTGVITSTKENFGNEKRMAVRMENSILTLIAPIVDFHPISDDEPPAPADSHMIGAFRRLATAGDRRSASQAGKDFAAAALGWMAKIHPKNLKFSATTKPSAFGGRDMVFATIKVPKGTVIRGRPAVDVISAALSEDQQREVIRKLAANYEERCGKDPNFTLAPVAVEEV